MPVQHPSYTYAVEDLFTGSSLGNQYSFARLDEQTNLKGLWSSSDNQYYLGEWTVEITADGMPLDPRTTCFFPESQSTDLVLKDVAARKFFFIPFAIHGSAEITQAGMRMAIYTISLTNSSEATVEFGIRHALTFPAVLTDRFTKQPPQDQIAKKVSIICEKNHVEIATVDKQAEARVFRSLDVATLCRADDRTLSLEYTYRLESGQTREISFMLSFSPEGMANALESSHGLNDVAEILENARQQYRQLLSRSFLFTPDSKINRGIQWAKVNTARVQHHYRSGEGFTNDPPQDIIVIRDLGWYVLGSDYVTPGFSASLLALCEKYAFHEGGKLTEYLHANEEQPTPHDYGLNINDDTPLYVYGLFHHGIASGNNGFLQRAFINMKRASDWIVSQVQDDLVSCRAEGTNVWGICGWRNIIDDYNLTGAVTEVNAECYQALSHTAAVARHLGATDDALRYAEAANRLKLAINTTLVSELTGFYLLNLSNDGVRHHDVTGDLIFPVMFGVAEGERRRNILRCLLSSEFWTPYGTRTVSPKEKNYDPDFGCQLVGGVWPNLAAWTAYCVRKEQPEKLIEGMRNIYHLSETDRPREFLNVVPGEFPERLHGENFVSRGMALSPWMPPTYLWLAIEGLFGVKPSLEGLEITPILSSSWKWMAVRDLLYKGGRVTAFFYEGTLYSTAIVTSEYPVKTGVLLSASSDHDSILSIGMMVDGEVLVLIASDREAEGNLVLEYNDSLIEKHIRLASGEAMLLRFPGVATPGEVVPVATAQK